MQTRFIIRLILVYIFAPLFGSILANIPGSLIFRLVDTGNIDLFNWYGILMVWSVKHGYPTMLLGIYFIGVYAWLNYKLPAYMITGVFIGIMAVSSVAFLIHDLEAMLIAILINGAINGMAIATVSYFLMGRTDRQTEDKTVNKPQSIVTDEK